MNCISFLYIPCTSFWAAATRGSLAMEVLLAGIRVGTVVGIAVGAGVKITKKHSISQVT